MRAPDPRARCARGARCEAFRTARDDGSLDPPSSQADHPHLAMKRSCSPSPSSPPSSAAALVVAVIAAFGGLGSAPEDGHHRPGAPRSRPSNASQRARRPHAAPDLRARRARRRVRHLDDRAARRIAVQPLRRRRKPAPGPGHRLGHRDRQQRHDPHQLPRRRERDQGHRQLRKRQDASKRRWSARTPPTTSPCCASTTDGLTLHPLTLGDSSTASRSATRCSRSATRSTSNARSRPASISALQRQITAPNGFTINNVLQTDAPINPGNSGGPLLDAAGRVIGINSQIETGGSGGGSVGIGFAVPINTAKAEIAQLEKGGTVRGAYLGLTSLTIDGSLSALNLPVKSGALVQSVQKGTPAAKAGIRGGTISAAPKTARSRSAATSSSRSTARPITSSEDLASAIGAKKPGDTVSRRAAARQRQGRLRTQDGQRDARQPARLGAEREHARRLGRRPRAAARGHARPTATVGSCRRRERVGARPHRGPHARGPHTQVKICGITSLHDAELAVELGAWAIGMVFYRAQPAALLARRGAADRRRAAPPGRAVRRVRQRAARGDRARLRASSG